MGFLRPRIVEWVAISFSRGFPDPGIEPASPATPAVAGGFFTTEIPVKGPREGDGNSLQYSSLGKAMDRGDCQATVHGVTKESDRT